MLAWRRRPARRASLKNRLMYSGSCCSSSRRTFDRDQPVHRDLAGLEDDAHAPLAQPFENLEAGDGRGRGGIEAFGHVRASLP